MAWIIFLVLAIPLLAVLAWVVLDDSFVRIEPGHLGLLLVHGRATDRVLDPGPHWVPAFRRRTVVTYPSLELSYRTGTEEPPVGSGGLERRGPALRVALGDRTMVTVAYTLRFRLDLALLRQIHERFGADGLWSAVRDVSARTLRLSLADPEIGVDHVFGAARHSLDQRLSDDLTQALAHDGFVLTMFHLGDLDLGRTGEVIEATARAGHELQREQAEAAMRVERARIDAELAPYVAAGATDAALRYREVDSWRELAQATGFLPPSVRPGGAEPDASAARPAEPTTEAQ